MKPVPILVVDDDESTTTAISVFLRAKGYDVTVANSGDEALDEIGTDRYPIVVSDIYIDQVDGLQVLRQAKARNPHTTVILMTARGSVRTTIEAETEGAFEYLAKPFEMRELLAVIERAHAATHPPVREEAEAEMEPFGRLAGFSPPMVAVYKFIARAARSEETVPITGETGAGKELVARTIHEHSARQSSSFLAVDAGTVPGTLWESEIVGFVRGAYTGADRDRPGIVETARGGTVFFDEIGEVPLDFQAKLLRLLQEKEFRPVGAALPRKADVRIMAATNRNLEAMVTEGKFRHDLFYRLNVLRIEVPPLRARPDDILLLARRFLAEATKAADKRIWLQPDAEALLQTHHWPGNVRQLENLVRRLVALNPPGPLSSANIRAALEPAPNGMVAGEDAVELSEVERRQILRVLQQTGGNKTRAAEILGIQRRTLYKKLARMERERSGHGDGPAAPE